LAVHSYDLSNSGRRSTCLTVEKISATPPNPIESNLYNSKFMSPTESRFIYHNSMNLMAPPCIPQVFIYS